ncbi:MAG: hypothetical protein ACYDHG_18140 [Desulfomonilaceae bacterium]
MGDEKEFDEKRLRQGLIYSWKDWGLKNLDTPNPKVINVVADPF